MPAQSQDTSMRTLVLFIVLVPVIGYLLYFAYKKNAESETRADQCRQECLEQGYVGHEFKWSVFSGPQCACL